MTETEPLLVMENITKTFPGVLALQDASLRVGSAEVHALIGQNGAGKSTMIKVLTGAYRKDHGSIRLAGKEVEFHSPGAAQRGGISTIYQEVNLVGFRSVAENIFLGREPRRGPLIDGRRMHTESRQLLARFDIHVDVTEPLGAQSIAVQQMVAIARAVSFQSRLVIMDEPTSSLDEREVETLFGVIRQLKQDGVSVIFVSHRLDELYAVCDRVTIMRDGRTVDERDMREISKLELVARMLGKEIGELRRQGETAFAQTQATSDELLLDARGLQTGPALRNAHVNVRPGEIVGLAGLLGSGRTETARALFGADELQGGEIHLNGRPVHLHAPADAIGHGIGFCSEDRKTEGIIPHMSVRENLTLALLPALSRAGIVDAARQAEIVDRFIARLGIKTSGPDQKIRELSGGNQQKVLLARWLCLNPKLLILDEPTRGIDVGAKGEIQALLSELAQGGLGVLMISSELEELAEGASRVFVLRDGHTVAELPRAELSQDAIMQVMAHGEGASVASVASQGGAHA
ncbi:sugar ABC transporter ATP-binding protein [Deinococcus peraridilitoris]|uniref:ABC-type sugar transport system, ATPase component n=1 Tax=Deinococcus peraridilitoris (strain DSM 19664 / LMG 22246 / CIP 109416 / KR-200) TaxID=937777 RepID=L0A251_DEIPD|nr:sugar ABC transporter ATP-binding protein [Deinococcus peraridilitoris]AFZ67524.1 ABC-type sugar transport system, ATPase component [Deinococcus peraridilitoris DSM 19664]